MASGDRRLGSSGRRGMTVLGKIPAVPKPINLPSQRLENRGLDPSVEIVPRGTFSWGSGRSPPATSGSWGSAGLSSSPPVGSGAWSSTATNSPVLSSCNSPGIENPQRPMSAGNARPLSAGASRPLSASATTGRAWSGATKLEEQAQPSRFNLTNADFPTLGSEKDSTWRAQQNTSTSIRPNSADGTKERHVTYTNHDQSVTLIDRPTSADATKERKASYRGAPNADRPTSADGPNSDKGRQPPGLRVLGHPPFVDGAVSDQRHLVFTGVIAHGTTGPGPGVFDGPRENVGVYPFPVQQPITAQGKEYMFPGASQHDVYFNRPGVPHSNDVVVLPVNAGPEVYSNYTYDSRPNQSDIGISHHPRAIWGPNHVDRSGISQGQFAQAGPPERFRLMQPAGRHMENAGVHEPAVVNRRDGFSIGEEQRAGWARPNMVFISPPVDARESSIPLTAGNQKFPRPEMFLAPWGHQPMRAGGNNLYGSGLPVGLYQEMPSSVIHHAPYIETMPEGSPVEDVTENTKINDKQSTNGVEVAYSTTSEGLQAASSSSLKPGRKDLQYSKQKETVKSSGTISTTSVSDILRKANHVQASGGPHAGTRPIITKQADEGPRIEQKKESRQADAISNVASQMRESIADEHSQGCKDQFMTKNSNNLSQEDTKNISKTKTLNLKHLDKGSEEIESLVHEKGKRKTLLNASDEKSTSLLNSSDGNPTNFIPSSSVPHLTPSGKEIKNDSKDASTLDSSQNSEITKLKSLTKEYKATSVSNLVVPAEEVKVPFDDGSKTKRNVHSVRRTQGRSMHESHPADRQNVNHGMVWTPKPLSGGIIRDDTQPSTGDADAFQESSSTTNLGKKRGPRPSQEHGGQVEIQVQQVQSVAISQQGQAQQSQELPIGSNKKPYQQVQYQRGERGSKKQGPKVQHQHVRNNMSEHYVQDDQIGAIMCKDEDSSIKYQHTVPSSNTDIESLQTLINQNQAQAKQTGEATEQVGGSIVIPVLSKSEGKKQSSIYAPKAPRNPHRLQHDQEHEAVNSNRGQHLLSKEENPEAEGVENPPTEVSSLSAVELKKGRKEVKSRGSRNIKQLKGDLEAGASSASDGHLLSGERYQGEAKGETWAPSFSVEAKEKDKEGKAHNQKHLRPLEMQMKQSTTVSHQDHGYVKEDLKTDTLTGESSTARAEKRYVPKQAIKQYLQQEQDVAESHKSARQRQTTRESAFSNDRGKLENQGPQPLATHAPARKGDMLRYTPIPARKKSVEGQQPLSGNQPGQKLADLHDVQALGDSFSNAGNQLACTVESSGKGDNSRSLAIGHKDGNKAWDSPESIQIKKEVKQYVAKSGGKQYQSSPKFDEEVSKEEEKGQRSHHLSGLDSVKRKEGVKPSAPRSESAKQEESSSGLERNIAKETGALHMPEQKGLVVNEKQEKSEFSVGFQKAQNHLMKAVKPLPSYRLSKRNPSPSKINNSLSVTEDKIVVSRMEEKNNILKDHKQDENLGIDQKTGSRQGSIDVSENPGPGDAEVARPKQNQRRRYQYQPVAQHLQTGKPQLDASSTNRPNNRDAEQGQNRHERGEGPRRGRGQGFYYRPTEHLDSSNVW